MPHLTLGIGLFPSRNWDLNSSLAVEANSSRERRCVAVEREEEEGGGGFIDCQQGMTEGR